nr:efflux RND transporter periplasmic adaptor subunit [Actinomycetota bacterium]
GSNQSTSTATIELDDPSVAANYDTAAVDVVLTDAKKTGVLKVPVTALVALAEGGYGVQVADASVQGSHLVGVTPGLYTDTEVEVTNTNLQAGDKILVPASTT